MLLEIVLVTGLDDGIRDGTVEYTISMVTQSDDPAYDNLHPTSVSMTHFDNLAAG